MRVVAAWAALVTVLTAPWARAGPPYVTDDPETVVPRHWEYYVASESFHDKNGWWGTAPHVEVNYGLVPNLQLHLQAPIVYSIPDRGPKAYGYGDTELGFKLRFIQETKRVPMVAFYPFLEVPTGARGLGLGNGSAEFFLSVWVQKSFGPWQTYGGVGIWIDAGDRDRHWWYFGWQLQRRLFKWVTVGAEVFHLTPTDHGAESDTRFNLGAVFDIGSDHHVLLSAGRGFAGPNLFQGYVAYQLTFGPK